MLITTCLGGNLCPVYSSAMLCAHDFFTALSAISKKILFLTHITSMVTMVAFIPGTAAPNDFIT
jgi:hypothetical protein